MLFVKLKVSLWIFDISTKAIIHNRLRTVSPFSARCRFIGMLDGPDALALPWQKIFLFFFTGGKICPIESTVP